jgi:copper ion binding protein
MALALVTACVAEESPAAAEGEEERIVTATFAVEGMTCGGCEAGVELKVGRLAGVEAVEASYEEGRASVTYAPDQVTPEVIVEAIEELGYSAELVEEPDGAGSDALSERST